MTEVAVWVAGVLLGAAAATVAAWVGLVWWFGDRDLFARQYPTHRAGDEPEPKFVSPNLRIPPNLFPDGRGPEACPDSSLLGWGSHLLQADTSAPPGTPDPRGAGTGLAGDAPTSG
jgi:hypothetical protein